MAKQSNEKSKPCLPCYTKIQASEEVDDGLEGVKILELNSDNYSKPSSNPDRYRLKLIPNTFAQGTVIVGSATYLNKYNQLIGLAKSMTGGPNFVDTRDNKIEIHNGKQSGKTVFAYTYAGGTGELLEFDIRTKYVHSIEAGKVSSVDPNTKTIETDLVQCIPTNDDPCKPDTYLRSNKPDLTRLQRDVTRMSKVKSTVYPVLTECRKINNLSDVTKSNLHIYNSTEDAYNQNLSNPSLTIDEIKAYNRQLENTWNKYKKELQEYSNAIKSGKTDVSLPVPPDEVEYFLIKRSVYVWLNPHDYVPEEYKYQYGGNKAFWKMGYRALKERKDITIIPPPNGGQYSPGDNYGNPGDRVLVQMELEIQLPGVRVVSDPLFTTLGDFIPNDIIESVNSQIKAKAKFVGNPYMKSSQVIEIKNVGQRYSGDWYTKEVEHSFDTGGYFTEVTFEKKSRDSILNRVSTSVNMQEVFQKAHDIAEKSYTNEAWKLPSIIQAEVKKFREETWLQNRLLGRGNQVGHQVVVVQNTDNPSNYTIVDSHEDFNVSRDMSIKRP